MTSKEEKDAARRHEIAAALGAKDAEVVQVDDTPAGIRAVLSDGTAYMLVPDDTPDGEGKTGVMFLDPPPSMHGGTAGPYQGTFPVFVNPGGKKAIHAPATGEDDDNLAATRDAGKQVADATKSVRTAQDMQQDEAKAVTSKAKGK